MSILENQKLKTNHQQPLCDASASGAIWVQTPVDEHAAAQLAQQHGLPQIVATLLVQRGVKSADVDTFLNPRLKTSPLPDPMLFQDMRVGAERLVAAIIAGETIAIFGDYDVDGATSSALLSRYLRGLGCKPIVYIPDRMKEGYGPNAAAFDTLKAQGASLVITVDCGTLAFEPLKHAHDLGLDVVVVDHHQAEAKLPDALAVINPNRLDENGLCRQLAAVGVAYLLLIAVQRLLDEDGYFSNSKHSHSTTPNLTHPAGGGGKGGALATNTVLQEPPLPGAKLPPPPPQAGGIDRENRTKPDLLTLLDLVAIGTVCDVVPLTELNRALVNQGLKIINQGSSVGVHALREVAGVMDKPMQSSHLGFALGPRINAGGRVGRASAGVELLTTDDALKAKTIAEELDKYNAERRAIEADMVEQALEQAEADVLAAGGEASMVVVANSAWHQGIIGIVASRLKEKFNRPAIVISLEQGSIGKGSCRSVAGFDMGAAIISAASMGLLMKGGGHAMAAGFSIDPTKLGEFKAFMNNHYQVADCHITNAQHQVDATIRASGVNLELVNLLEQLAPFGSGNPEPLIMLPSVRLLQSSVVGQGHVKSLWVDAAIRHQALSGITFRAEDSQLGQQLLRYPQRIWDILVTLEINHWQGTQRVNVMVKDAALKSD